MTIYPAIDLRFGSVVRLTQGDYDRMTVYDKDPVRVALSFAGQGATHLHVVDLDGAKDGGVPNASVISAILRSVNMSVEVGGGIRSFERIEAYLNAGAARVILGTAALENPGFRREAVARYGASVAVGVDASGGKVAVRGWREVSETDSFTFCRTLAQEGVDSVIYTDIARDGALGGTNLEAYRRLCTIKNLHIVASGGISGTDDLKALSDMGIDAAILGKALYSRTLSLKDALSFEKGGSVC